MSLTKLQENRIKRNLNQKSKFSDIVSKIGKILSKWNIKDYTINSDGDVDVDGDVNLSFELENYFGKIPFQFGKVTGDFILVGNEMTSLEGSPKIVGGDFDCSETDLKSLEGAPKEVGGSFYCNHNNLTTLKGAPQKVGKDFWCHKNYNNFKKEDVNKVSKVKGNIKVDTINSYGVDTDNVRMDESTSFPWLEFRNHKKTKEFVKMFELAEKWQDKLSLDDLKWEPNDFYPEFSFTNSSDHNSLVDVYIDTDNDAIVMTKDYNNGELPDMDENISFSDFKTYLEQCFDGNGQKVDIAIIDK